MSRPVRLAYGLCPLIEVLNEYGHPVDPLFAATEIPQLALEEPNYHISLSQELAFTRRALATLKLAQAGLVVGQRFHLPGGLVFFTRARLARLSQLPADLSHSGTLPMEKPDETRSARGPACGG